MIHYQPCNFAVCVCVCLCVCMRGLHMHCCVCVSLDCCPPVVVITEGNGHPLSPSLFLLCCSKQTKKRKSPPLRKIRQHIYLAICVCECVCVCVCVHVFGTMSQLHLLSLSLTCLTGRACVRQHVCMSVQAHLLCV